MINDRIALIKQYAEQRDYKTALNSAYSLVADLEELTEEQQQKREDALNRIIGWA